MFFKKIKIFLKRLFQTKNFYLNEYYIDIIKNAHVYLNEKIKICFPDNDKSFREYILYTQPIPEIIIYVVVTYYSKSLQILYLKKELPIDLFNFLKNYQRTDFICNEEIISIIEVKRSECKWVEKGWGQKLCDKWIKKIEIENLKRINWEKWKNFQKKINKENNELII